MPGVCTWHLAEVVVHRSSGRGSQRRRIELVVMVCSRGQWCIYRSGPYEGRSISSRGLERVRNPNRFAANDLSQMDVTAAALRHPSGLFRSAG